MTLLATLGYAVQGACALRLRPFLRLVDPLGPVGSRVPALDDGRQPALAAAAILGLSFAHDAVTIGILLCLAGAASAALSLNFYAVAQMFAGPRASGTWVGVQNAIGNFSGIVGPIVTGIIVQRPATTARSSPTAAVAAVGAALVGHRRSENRTARPSTGNNRRATEFFEATSFSLFSRRVNFFAWLATRDDSEDSSVEDQRVSVRLRGVCP